MSKIVPAKIGILADYTDDAAKVNPHIARIFEMIADDYREAGLLERPIEIVVRAAHGLPEGSYSAVEKAYRELVEEDCLVIFGPCVSENAVPLRDCIEDIARVPCIGMGGTESMLSDWFFGLPNGSMEEEPIIMAKVAAFDGCETIGIVFEDSLLGNEYLRAGRAACRESGLKVVSEVAVPQVASDKREAVNTLREASPDGIMHLGFGLGLLGINSALKDIGWSPRRYTTTAFEFWTTGPDWMEALADWVGLDQYDERNQVGQDLLDRYEAKHGQRPENFFTVYAYDVGRLMIQAVATARPLTGKGVKEALERIKMLPAASGAPGTYVRYGKFIRHGWLGAEFLVARRVLSDASKTVMHATINGLVDPV